MPTELTDRPVGADGAGTVGGAVGVKDPLMVALPIVLFALFVPVTVPVTPGVTSTVPVITVFTRFVFCKNQDVTPVPLLVA